MVKAVLRSGRIQPVTDLPENWVDGEELIVEAIDEAEICPSAEVISAWARELEEGASRISSEDVDRFLRAVAEQREIGKAQIRRQMGLDV